MLKQTGGSHADWKDQLETLRYKDLFLKLLLGG